MSDHWQRIERGLRRILTIVPKIPLFKSPARNNELSRCIVLLGLALFACLYPLETVVLVLAASWLMGGDK